ncbi:uncharacterized protein Tsen34 [Drosophila tropicalis]|uniref:uncharacterized protein Tsen34 n=1 Tax=Drosophila tropicalis TaxID=46794 RepID=UPI0035AC1F6F
MYLTLLNGTGYTFSINDYMELRMRHRILGVPVGTANNKYKGWSPQDAALPVEFSKFETQLLLDKGLAFLVDKSQSLSITPSAQEIKDYKKTFNSRIDGQKNALKSEKLKETERYLTKIVMGKRNKLLKLGLVNEANDMTAEKVLKEIADDFKFEVHNTLVEVPGEHLAKHTAELYLEPLIDVSGLKYRIFCDLWQKKKFITSGEAFGADFLVYPGDPLIYHASHIVIVQEDSVIRPLQFIGKVRLSVTVNKSCIFAYEDNNRICYQTVNWSNCIK